MDKGNVNLDDIKPLFEAGLHLGHKKNRLHPKAKKFVYRIESGVSIIDLTQTIKQIAQAKAFLTNCAKEKKNMLVVATKRVAAPLVIDLCKPHKIAFVTTKWLPGLLTNFDTIIKNVKKLKELKKDKEEGTWDKLIKHEKVKLNKHMIKLEKFYGGLVDLEKRPDLLLILDTKKEKNAVIEAQKMQIPIIAVVDTNVNPDQVDYPIVANDDSPSSVNYLINELIQAYVSGMK